MRSTLQASKQDAEHVASTCTAAGPGRHPAMEEVSEAESSPSLYVQSTTMGCTRQRGGLRSAVSVAASVATAWHGQATSLGQRSEQRLRPPINPVSHLTWYAAMKSAADRPTFRSTSPAPRKKVSGRSSAMLRAERAAWRGVSEAPVASLHRVARKEGPGCDTARARAQAQHKHRTSAAQAAHRWDRMMGRRVRMPMGDTPLCSNPVSSSAHVARRRQFEPKGESLAGLPAPSTRRRRRPLAARAPPGAVPSRPPT